ncbi:MAG: hypothetical protein K9G28_06520 [Candidatus Nanopelagicales bacterium]|nr:hypothetical protein [Candidatus Nanopelagicales bacterium]
MRRFVAIAASVLGIASLLAGPALAADEVTEVCRFSDPRFTEISGMTYSQRHADVLYLHNDSSGGPLLFAVDASTCDTLATLTISGIEARDLEAIGSGRDAKGRPILWLADIGDNRDSWSEVRLHRVREPRKLRDRTLPAATYRFTYPDRPHNAEAILADPSSERVWVVTKQTARGRIYELPDPLRRDRVNVARPVGKVGAFVTDGAVSPQGNRFVLRDYVDAEVFAGLPPGADAQTVYLPIQFQGEAITWTADGAALLVASERDDRLLRVLAPAPSTNTPASGPVSASQEPAEPPQLAPRGEGDPQGEEDQSAAWTYLGFGALLLVAAAALVIRAEARRRREQRQEPDEPPA